MKAKIYSKKKLFSLLVLPFVAGTITAKSTLAAGTVYNPLAGETVHVSGINDPYSIFTYNEEVTVILDAAAQIVNDASYNNAAVHLGPDATVAMKAGSKITTSNASGNAYGVELYNNYSYTGAINQVSMDQAAISATATAGSAAGIYSGYWDNYRSDNVSTQITLDNNSSISATASGAGTKYAAGIYLDSGDGSAVIAMDHGSSITAESTVTPAANNNGQAVAQGIYLHQGDIQVTLDNGAKIDVTATATTTGYGTASVNYTYGIYAESEAFGESVVSMNHASTITGTAAATADKYATIWENSGIQVWNDNEGDVSVTLANKSSIANTSTATVNNSGKYSSTARVTDSYGIYAHSDSGDSDVSLDSGATITIAATATNNNLGSSVNDRAYATDIYGIHALSYYGDTSVTLNNLSHVSATAKATAQDRATADAVGVYAGAEGYESSGNATVTMRAGSTITATAETNTTPGSESTWNGARSWAQGAEAYTYYGDASVLLDLSSVTTTAKSTSTAAAGVASSYSYANADAYGIYAGSGEDGRALVDLRNGSTATATATATNDSSAAAKYSNDNDASADAYGIEAYSDYGRVQVNLDSSSVTAKADATAKGNADSTSNDAWAGAYGIGAEGWSGRLDVNLSGSTVKADATATGDGWAGAEGIGIYAGNSWWYSSSMAGTTVTLDASTVGVTATAKSTGGGAAYGNRDATAGATAIYAQTNGIYRDAQVTVTNLSKLSATATATAADGRANADADGIYVDSDYSQANITVSLNSSVTTSATATSTSTAYGSSDAYAWSTGISADGAEGAAVTLTDSSVTAGATATTAGVSDAGAYAYGIDLTARNNTGAVTLAGGVISATATATAPLTAPVIPNGTNFAAVATGGWANASAYGIAVDSWGDNNTVNLTDSQINATATASGFYAGAEGIGVRVDGNNWYGNAPSSSVTLDNTDIAAKATATAAGSNYSNASAMGIDLYLSAEATVDLSNTASITATATGSNTVGNMNAYAGGINAGTYSHSGSYDYYYPTAASTVSLDNAAISATATSTAGDRAWAGSRGIGSWATARHYTYNNYDYGDSAAYSTIDLTGATLTLKSTATGDQADAWSQGVDGSSYAQSRSDYPAYADADIAVNLDNSKISTQAQATGVYDASAYAGGIDAYNRANAMSRYYNAYADSNTVVNLSNNSAITATATALASADGGEGWAQAIGIRASANANGYAHDNGSYAGGAGFADTSVTLSNSSISVAGTATGADGGEGSATAIKASAGASGYGDHLNSYNYTYGRSIADVYVDLSNSTLAATGSFNGNYGVARATGIQTSSWSDSGSYYDSMYAMSDTEINLDTVTLSAKATASGNYSDAMAAGITANDRAYAGNYWYYGDATDAYADSNVNITLNAATVTVSAASKGAYTYAEAIGIEGLSSADSDTDNVWSDALTSVSIDLTGSKVAAAATADGIDGSARAIGVNADAHSDADGYGVYTYSWSDATINLTDSSVTATATANGDYGYASADGVLAEATAHNWGIPKYSEANATINLTNSSVTASATANGDYGRSRAVGLAATSENYYTFSSVNDISINLADSSVTASASADGTEGQAMAIGVVGGYYNYYTDTLDSINIDLTNSTVDVTASAQGIYGSAMAGGVGAIGSKYNNTDITINLDNAAINATATSNDTYGMSYAVGVIAGTADNVLINLTNDSSISAVASGERTYAAGIMIYDTYTASVNIDASSSVSGGDFAIIANNIYNATVTNYGLIAGRVDVTDLNNLTDLDGNTGTLQATLTGTDQEWIADPLLYNSTTQPFYFTASNSATLADGTTLAIVTSDDLGFTAPGQVKEYALVGTALDGGTWDPAMLSVVKSGYQSPLLQFSYSDPADVVNPGLSDADHYILRVELLSPTEAGLTPNAGSAAGAALADGLLDFNSNPEEWSPEIMSKVFGSLQFIHGNLYNIENRLGEHSGANSGDPNAKNSLWVDANYTDGSQDRVDNIEGFDTETMAFNLGYDRRFSSSALLGLSFGYGNTEAETEMSRRTIDMDEYMVSLYGQVKGEGWFGEGQFSAGWGDADSLRYVGATAYTASFDSNTYYAKLTGGLDIDAGGWSVMPKASVDYVSISFDDYQEAGGPLGLTVSSDTYDASNIGAGLKVMNRGKVVTPELGAMLYYDMIGDTIQTSSRFNGGSTYFQTEGADPARTSWELSAGLTFEAPSTPITFKVGYDLLGREDFMSHNFSGKLNFDF